MAKENASKKSDFSMARQIGTRRKMVFFTGAGFSLGFGWLWFEVGRQ